MNIPPIGKLYFRPKQQKRGPDYNVQKEISEMKSEISEMKRCIVNLQLITQNISQDLTNIKSFLNSINAPSGSAPIYTPTQPVTSTLVQQQHYVSNRNMRDHSRSYSASPHTKQVIPPTALSPQTSPS